MCKSEVVANDIKSTCPPPLELLPVSEVKHLLRMSFPFWGPRCGLHEAECSAFIWTSCFWSRSGVPDPSSAAADPTEWTWPAGQAYQAVAVAQGHVAGVRPVLQVSGVVAAGRVRAAPGQAAFLPVLHPELSRQQAALQREVQQEVVAWRGQLVEELRDGRKRESSIEDSSECRGVERWG